MAKFSSSSASSSSPTFHSTIQSPSTPLIINPTNAPTSHRHSDEKNLGDISMQFGKARCCDVFIGSCASLLWEMHFVKWLRAELKMQGFSCSLSDRSKLQDARSLAVARATMDATAVGMVVVTTRTFSNPYSVEELQVFLESGKLIPIFLGLTQSECLPRDIMEKRGNLWEKHGGACWNSYGGIEKEWMEVINGLSRVNVKLEVKEDNMRSCILVAVRILGTMLGRKNTVEKVRKWVEFAEEEFPFPRNTSFVGRKKELLELESLLFGDGRSGRGEDEIMKTTSSDQNPSLTEERVGEISEDVTRKGKGPAVWQDSDGDDDDDDDDKIELQFRNGLALVTGDSGIGKTELLLEFAYRFSQRYKMVLWVGGEAKYIRRNYMKLLPLLGVDIDVVAENELSLGKQGGRPKKFEDMEGEAIGKVRRELMRDIPFLLIIDNLEKEEDWWDGRNVMELLPRLGAETHVLISTRLPHALNIRPQKLLHLSSSEAMLLMRGSLSLDDLPVEDIDALRAIEEKLRRLPLALGLVGAILAELQISPCKLLDKINGMPYRQLPRSGNKEDLMLRRNSFLVKLLDFCFSIFYQTEKSKKLGLRMIQSSSWFAPAPLPVSMLALAGKEDISEGSLGNLLWKICRRRFTCMCTRQPNNVKSSEDELADIMVRLRIARSCTKIGCIYVHDIIKLYAYNTDNSYNSAHAVVQAISTEGSIQEHSDHALAACFLVFKFGNTPSVVDLSVQGIVSFIKRIVLPLAMQDLRAFSQFTCVLELLRVATEALETMEDLFLSDGDSSSNKSPVQFDPHWYNEFAHLRATLLESRAKLMIQGGLYDIAEQLCRTTLNIKEVMCGWEHPETQATRQMIEKLIRLQSNF